MDSKLPEVSKGLIEYLERMYPDRLPMSVDVEMKSIYYQMGAVSVINLLKRIVEQREKKDLGNVLL